MTSSFIRKIRQSSPNKIDSFTKPLLAVLMSQAIMSSYGYAGFFEHDVTDEAAPREGLFFGQQKVKKVKSEKKENKPSKPRIVARNHVDGDKQATSNNRSATPKPARSFEPSYESLPPPTSDGLPSAPASESVDLTYDQEPGSYATNQNLRMPPTEFNQTILLSQEYFHSLTQFGFYFDQFFKTSAGLLVDTATESDTLSHMMYGPILLGEAEFKNPTILTPLVSVGVTSLFHRYRFEEDAASFQTSALYAAIGIDIEMTENFSLLIQRMTLNFDTPIFGSLEEPSDEDGRKPSIKWMARSQISFHFRF